MGVLYKTKTYLAGGIQNFDGFSWRKELSDKLLSIGIVPLNPLEKPFINLAPEDKDTHTWLAQQMESGNLHEVKKYMIQVRRMDYRMIDSSDFVIAHIHPTIASYGTASELDLCERMLKPTFISVEGGVKKTPYWLLSMFDDNCFFNSIDDIFNEIKDINNGDKTLNDKYWRLFKTHLR
jgi:nucleoside 2-deoxyribosyltransferase